jgi:prevent-host-death family protein
MKTILATSLRTNVDGVLDSSQAERIVIVRNGRPSAVLVGIEDYDEEDMQLASSPEFWRMIGERRTGGRSLPLAEVESRLAVAPRKPTVKPRRPN